MAGACCDSSQCGDDGVCVDHQCAACRADADCPPNAAACVKGHCKARVVQAAVTACVTDANCPALSKCCGGICLSGECCTNAECALPDQCLQNACQTCTSDGQCGAGSLCCSGTCVAGACCPGTQCSNGQVCLNSRCSRCTADSECGAGGVCCNGTCSAGNCCTTADCGQYVCQGSQCGTCTADADCGANSLCCRGACVAGGQCCDAADCAGGAACIGNRCLTCRSDLECGNGQQCCGGACRSGECCTTADCTGGEVCNPSGFCGVCSGDSQCGTGQKCCGGACVNGTCCIDSECGAGKRCENNSCQSCQTDAQCGRGQLCCNGGCQTGNCCSPTGTVTATPECNGLVCSGSACTQCLSDTQCGAGAKCCRGGCYAGIGCCSDADCLSGERCTDGQCKGCSTDESCGALSCCKDCSGVGRCLAACEVTQFWSDRGTFDQGTHEGTAADGTASTLNTACVAGTLCRTLQPYAPVTPLVWVAASSQGAVYKYDTVSGARSGPYVTGVVSNWPAGAGTAAGASPAGTAVNVYDQTLWVANRGGAGRASPSSGVAHLGFDGAMRCYAGVPGGASSVAIDGRGDVWVGALGRQLLTKFSGTDLEPGAASPPACKKLAALSMPMSPAVAATDEKNQMWVVGTDGRIVSIDPTAVLITRIFDANCAVAGLAVDRTSLWVSCYSLGGVNRVDRTSGAPTFISTGGTPRGLVAGATDVYVSKGDGSLARINKTSLAVVPVPITATSANVMAAADSTGRVWAVDSNGPVSALQVNQAQTSYAGASGQTPEGDITGQQFVNVGLAPARWNAIYDSNYPTPRWISLALAANTPVGATVTARVRVAPSQTELGQASWSAWQASIPVDLVHLNLPSKRFLEMELRFAVSGPGKTAQVGEVVARWAPSENPICLCPPGYVRQGANCVDINECGINNGGCSDFAVCTNIPGGRTCTCKAGYIGDGTSCVDINECETNNGTCPGDETCTNTSGGLRCCPRCTGWDVVTRACVPAIEFFSVAQSSGTPTVYVRPPGVGAVYLSPTAYAGQATVNARTPVTYTMTGNPPWLSINPTTGLIGGTPSNNWADPGVHNVTLRATTTCGSTATVTFVVTVVGNQWCGDGVANGPETCDTQSRSCTSTTVVGLPSYCNGGGPSIGTESCSPDCSSWGACQAPAPTVSSNSFGECSNATIDMSNYYCCAMDACLNDACCGGANGTTSSLGGGYTEQAFLNNPQGNGNCRLGQSGTNWQVAVSHTTSSYRCWR